jgi:hypothetical protein
MNKENKTKLSILILFLFFGAGFLLDFFVLKIQPILVFLTAIFCVLAFAFFEAYTRIQHNIDKSGAIANSVKISLEEKIKKDEELFAQFTDFLDELLDELGKIKANSKEQEIAVLIEQVLEYEKEQTDFLKDEILKIKNGSN